LKLKSYENSELTNVENTPPFTLVGLGLASRGRIVDPGHHLSSIRRESVENMDSRRIEDKWCPGSTMRPLNAKPRPSKVNGGVFSTLVSSEFAYDFNVNSNFNFNN
jgi:hypothetical protein